MTELTRNEFAQLLELKAELEVLKDRVDSISAYIASDDVLHSKNGCTAISTVIPVNIDDLITSPPKRPRGRPKGSKNGKTYHQSP